MNPLCIYHADCDDGFAAAWIVRKALGADNVDFHPGVHGEEPPDVTGRDVIIVDFSYKRGVIEAMAGRMGHEKSAANSILILDHHKTAQADWLEFRKPCAWVPWLDYIGKWRAEKWTGAVVRAIFDMERSGAGLAWDYFFEPQERPLWVNYIEDRDLWRKALSDGDKFTIALRSYPREFEVWDQLFGKCPDPYMVYDLIGVGHGLQRYYRMRVEEFKKTAYKAYIPVKGASFGVNIVRIANAPHFVASEVAGELAEEAPLGEEFGACYSEVAPGAWRYDLRSRGDFDVSAVAKQYGGGGHKNAAGFVADKVVHFSDQTV